MGFVANAVQGILGAGGGQNASYSAAPISQVPNIVPQINQAQGNVQQLYGQQQALAGQLQQQMNGQGPNLAAAMQQQAQQQNIAQQAGLLGSQAGINPAMAARQASMNAAQAGQQGAGQAGILRMQQQLAAQQQLGGLYGQLGQQQGNNLQAQYGALQGQNQAVNAQSGVNQNMAGINANNSAKMIGGLMGGVGSGITSLVGLAQGGEVPEHLHGFAEAYGMHTGGYLAEKGGKVKAKSSSQKAEVQGDSVKNDKIPAMLSEKEIVIPREIAMHPDAPQKAAEFVANIKSQGGGSKDSDESDFHDALKREAGKRKKK